MAGWVIEAYRGFSAEDKLVCQILVGAEFAVPGTLAAREASRAVPGNDDGGFLTPVEAVAAVFCLALRDAPLAGR